MNPIKRKELADPNSKYPDRLAVFGAPLSSPLKEIPSREEFIAVVKHALTREIDFDQCFSDVAKGTILWGCGQERSNRPLD